MVRERSDELGRRAYDHKTPWPTYVGIVTILGTMWWQAAVNVTAAKQTQENVQQMQTQLVQMRETEMQLRRSIDVINCTMRITCEIK